MCVFVRVCVQCHVNVCERDDRRASCTVGAECQMVSVSKYYSTMCLLVVVKREGILSSDYAPASLSHTHIHIPTTLYLLLVH